MGFLETSALDGSNIDEAFNSMIEGIFGNYSFLFIEILKKNKSQPNSQSK